MFPAVLLHELCHLLVGLVLNAKPVSFDILPKKVDKEVVFGSVSFKNLRWYNVFFTSFAPLLIVPIVFLLKELFFLLKFNGVFYSYLYFYLFITFLYASIPSQKDISVFLKNYLAVLIAFALIVIAFFIFEKQLFSCLNFNLLRR